MIINIIKYPIINAFYGTGDKKINVLDILVKNYNNEINICNKLFKKDPVIGIKKKLYITLKNNNKYEINENEKLLIIDTTLENYDEEFIESIKQEQLNKDIKEIKEINEKLEKIEKLNKEKEKLLENEKLKNEKIDETNNKNIENQNIENQNIENQNIDNKNIDNKNIDNKNIDNKNIDNKNIDNKNIEKEILESNKYDFILSTNVRDEKNILEFLIYHILIGFDKILVIDHLSKNSVETKIKLLPNKYKNKIEVIRFDKEGSHKLHFLNNIIIPYMKKNCSKYFIHLDGDEYINLNDNYYDIKKLLNDFNNPDILCLNWLLFGSNDKDYNDNKYDCLIPTYTKCDTNLSDHFKILINVKILDNTTHFLNPHQLLNSNKSKTLVYTNICNKNFNYNDKRQCYILFKKSYPNISINEAKAYLNHYTVQSKEDYNNRKINRNRDDIDTNRKLQTDIFTKHNEIYNNNLLHYYKRIENMLNIDNLTFVILRYVINENTDRSWQECYRNIRQFYNNKIVIIDDHSDKKFLSEIELENCYIIQSEFKGRGELLPYYYFLKDKFSKKIVVLHDSMILHQKIDFSHLRNFKNFTRIFSFPNGSYNIDIKFFKDFCGYIENGDKVFKYHSNHKYELIGCFGVCYYIEYDFLEKIQNKYNILNLINFIDSRDKRKTLERFFSCLFEMEHNSKNLPHLVGNIFDTLTKQRKKKNVVIEKKFYGR